MNATKAQKQELLERRRRIMRVCLRAGIDPATKVVDLTDDQTAAYRVEVKREQRERYLKEAVMGDFRHTPCCLGGCEYCTDAAEVAANWAKELDR